MRPSPEPFPRWLQPLLGAFRLDFSLSPRRPSSGEVVFASVVALVGSLLADAVLVAIGAHVFPSTLGYVHLQFTDYAKLTTIGAIIACIGCPIVMRITSAARWLFLRLAAMVTLVPLLPDLYILHAGSPAKAVFVLVWMHVAIALVAYNALVNLAPVRRGRHARCSPRSSS